MKFSFSLFLCSMCLFCKKPSEPEHILVFLRSPKNKEDSSPLFDIDLKKKKKKRKKTQMPQEKEKKKKKKQNIKDFLKKFIKLIKVQNEQTKPIRFFLKKLYNQKNREINYQQQITLQKILQTNQLQTRKLFINQNVEKKISQKSEKTNKEHTNNQTRGRRLENPIKPAQLLSEEKTQKPTIQNFYSDITKATPTKLVVTDHLFEEKPKKKNMHKKNKTEVNFTKNDTTEEYNDTESTNAKTENRTDYIEKELSGIYYREYAEDSDSFFHEFLEPRESIKFFEKKIDNIKYTIFSVFSYESIKNENSFEDTFVVEKKNLLVIEDLNRGLKFFIDLCFEDDQNQFEDFLKQNSFYRVEKKFVGNLEELDTRIIGNLSRLYCLSLITNQIYYSSSIEEIKKQIQQMSKTPEQIAKIQKIFDCLDWFFFFCTTYIKIINKENELQNLDLFFSGYCDFQTKNGIDTFSIPVFQEDPTNTFLAVKKDLLNYIYNQIVQNYKEEIDNEEKTENNEIFEAYYLIKGFFDETADNPIKLEKEISQFSEKILNCLLKGTEGGLTYLLYKKSILEKTVFFIEKKLSELGSQEEEKSTRIINGFKGLLPEETIKAIKSKKQQENQDLKEIIDFGSQIKNQKILSSIFENYEPLTEWFNIYQAEKMIIDCPKQEKTFLQSIQNKEQTETKEERSLKELKDFNDSEFSFRAKYVEIQQPDQSFFSNND